MQPSKGYKKISRLINLCAIACGAGVLSKNYRINILTIFVLVCIALFFVFSVYTAHVKLQEGFAVMLGSFCMVGKAMQGLSKMLSSIGMPKSFYDQDQFLIQLYEEFEVKGEQYRQAMQNCIKRFQRVIKMVTTVYLVGCPLTMATPFILRLYDGRRTLALQILIPGLDVETSRGYTVVLTVQLLFFALGAFGNYAGDLFFYNVVTQFSLLVDILKLKINELNELALDPDDPKCLKALLDVLKWHQTYSKFTEDSDHLFFWINFTHITTSALSLILLLLIIIRTGWINAYTFIPLEFSMMYMYCGMGTVVEVANDKVSKELYAIHWYNLNVDQQMIIKLMLRKSQTPKELTIGGIIPLSVNTGLQVTKTVYSVFMMLVNVFSD